MPLKKNKKGLKGGDQEGQLHSRLPLPGDAPLWLGWHD